MDTLRKYLQLQEGLGFQVTERFHKEKCVLGQGERLQLGSHYTHSALPLSGVVQMRGSPRGEPHPRVANRFVWSTNSNPL